MRHPPATAIGEAPCVVAYRTPANPCRTKRFSDRFTRLSALKHRSAGKKNPAEDSALAGHRARDRR
jgi:hypothetical protein